MKRISLLIMIIFTCVSLEAQVNYVLNGGLEDYSRCPEAGNQIYRANHWRNAVDSQLFEIGMEYYNVCGNANPEMIMHVPDNNGFYQLPHSGNGLAGAHLFFNKNPAALDGPPLPLPFTYRDNLQGHLVKRLSAGKSYCVTFYVNNAEAAGYAHNKIGAYLDDGAINSSVDTPGEEILTVHPQVFTNDVVIDTAGWTKIEGSFTAIGNEDHITVGNFFPNEDLTAVVTYYWPGFKSYSYYLIDDISVVESDLKAYAGLDTWVEETKTVKIGRADDTTATAINCKWFHKGALIDSGVVITVNAAPTKGIIDTYVVMQTICGNVTMDTVLVSTVGLGVHEPIFSAKIQVFPNPSGGNIQIFSSKPDTGLFTVITDLFGRTVNAAPLDFTGNTALFKVAAPPGIYILSISDHDGNIYREQIIIR